MVHVRVLFSAFLATFIYVLLSAIFGQNGLIVSKHLLEEKVKISEHTKMLEAINAELSTEYTAMLKDKDIIASYARRLDYVGSGEMLVKITGMKGTDKKIYDVGSAVKHTECRFLSEEACKTVGLLVFVISFCFLCLSKIIKGFFYSKRAEKRLSKSLV